MNYLKANAIIKGLELYQQSLEYDQDIDRRRLNELKAHFSTGEPTESDRKNAFIYEERIRTRSEQIEEIATISYEIQHAVFPVQL